MDEKKPGSSIPKPEPIPEEHQEIWNAVTELGHIIDKIWKVTGPLHALYVMFTFKTTWIAAFAIVVFVQGMTTGLFPVLRAAVNAALGGTP